MPGKWLSSCLVRKVFEYRSDTLLDHQPALRKQCAVVTVNLRPYQRRDRDLVKKLSKRPLSRKFLGLLGRLLGVVRQQALVKGLIGLQNELVAEHHIEEFELWNVTTQNDEADRQRCRQQ